MKHNHRLDYFHFAGALGERGLVEPAALKDALRQSSETGASLCRLLVEETLIGDYELCRVACEVFSLPFVPVDFYAPAASAREGLDDAFLRTYCLVPLERFGDLLTVAMPGMVPSDVLTNLGRQAGVNTMAVVSTVAANRRWIEENLLEQAPAAGHALRLREDAEEDWGEALDASSPEVREAPAAPLPGTPNAADAREASRGPGQRDS